MASKTVDDSAYHGSGLTAGDSATSVKDVAFLSVDKPVVQAYVDVDEEDKRK
jgi:hypothetical protein